LSVALLFLLVPVKNDFSDRVYPKLTALDKTALSYLIKRESSSYEEYTLLVNASTCNEQQGSGYGCPLDWPTLGYLRAKDDIFKQAPKLADEYKAYYRNNSQQGEDLKGIKTDRSQLTDFEVRAYGQYLEKEKLPTLASLIYLAHLGLLALIGLAIYFREKVGACLVAFVVGRYRFMISIGAWAHRKV
jgi:hypothetical protein